MAVALRRWPIVWAVLGGAGTVYLAWLGLRSLRVAWTYRASGPTATADTGRPPWSRSLREGFVTNMLNPSR